MRPSGRAFNALRPISFIGDFHVMQRALCWFSLVTLVYLLQHLSGAGTTLDERERTGMGDSRVWNVARVDAYAI